MASQLSLPAKQIDDSALASFEKLFSRANTDFRLSSNERERMDIVPLVFRLMPRAAFGQATRIRSLVVTHLEALGVVPSPLLVRSVWTVTDQYRRSIGVVPGSSRPTKQGIEHLRALKSGLYERILRRQAHRCAVCGVRIVSGDNETLDHIVPWMLIGDLHDGSNWQLLCARCNTGKRSWLSVYQSPYHANWRYGHTQDELPLREPNLEERYIALALAGGCSVIGCQQGPDQTGLSVRLLQETGMALVDNIAVLCESHCTSLSDGQVSVTPLLSTENKTGGSQALAPSAGDADECAAVRIGDYLVEAIVGEGGGGVSYLAVSHETGEEVFLKAAPINTPEAAALKNEAGIYQRLQRSSCQHVVGVIELFEFEGRAILVCERGELSLENLVLSQGRGLAADKVLRIADQIVSGLEELHAASIVHRDLKPANVLTKGGRWFLIDFGISKNLQDVVPPVTFRMHGTSGYAAPEQFLRGASADASADVYSLGKVLVFLLTAGTDIDGIMQEDWRMLVLACTREKPSERLTLDDVRVKLERLGTYI